MDRIFPGVESEAFGSEVSSVREAIEALELRLGQVRARSSEVVPTSDVEDILRALNSAMDRMETVSTYVACLLSTDTRNEAFLAADSELELDLARLRRVGKDFASLIGSFDLAGARIDSPEIRDHTYALEKAQTLAKHLLSLKEEALISQMELTGSIAWNKLYQSITSQIEVAFSHDGQRQSLPISSIRAFASDADRQVRKNAYEAELEAWKKFEVPIASAMNSIKGETLALTAKRGWNDPQEEACFRTNIDPQTLAAMMTAAKEAFPDLRRYLKAKAYKLGVGKMAFYDLFAPLPGEDRLWTWDAAKEFVATQFDQYSSTLGDFARRAYAEEWIDVGPKPGKVDGAYCASVKGDVSRILLNFKPSFDSVRTLAHELGHGYHNVCLSKRTALQRETPNTLAETASIFCETIVKKGVLAHGGPEEHLAVLESSLCGACQVVIDIASRYQFESEVVRLRKGRELAPRELCELMLAAQRDTYGDGLDENQLHPYMWAAKPHYYGASFYNFPYMFGLLFSLGLYSRYEADPITFRGQYDELLSQTGMANAADLAQGFGFDLRTTEFWRGSFDQIRSDIKVFEQLVGIPNPA